MNDDFKLWINVFATQAAHVINKTNGLTFRQYEIIGEKYIQSYDRLSTFSFLSLWIKLGKLK